MSIGVIHELLRATIPRFKSLISDMPKSEKKIVLVNFQNRTKILEDAY